MGELRMKKKRNPQDTTLRNTRAANKRLVKLEKRMDIVEKKFEALTRFISKLEE